MFAWHGPYPIEAHWRSMLCETAGSAKDIQHADCVQNRRISLVLGVQTAIPKVNTNMDWRLDLSTMIAPERFTFRFNGSHTQLGFRKFGAVPFCWHHLAYKESMEQSFFIKGNLFFGSNQYFDNRCSANYQNNSRKWEIHLSLLACMQEPSGFYGLNEKNPEVYG